MFLRLSRVVRAGKTYQYAQLVESVRKPAAKHPLHHVVANLGHVTDVQYENLKAAFDANRTGAKVAVLSAADLAALAPQVEANRAWLDVVAALATWEASGLRDAVRVALGGRGDEVEAADVVGALVLQRCLAADSKLAAVPWFASTALPELLGIPALRMNNSRIHRVMARLDAAGDELQASLGQLLLAQPGEALTALFMDVTDTWFFGEGPTFATTGKTKEGMTRRKIHIVLLCDQRGLPLRHAVHEGNLDDGVAMLRLLRKLDGEGWLGSAPLAMDRAMGNTADFKAMAEMGLQFVTALCAGEHAAYGLDGLGVAIAAIDPDTADALAQVERAAERAGLQRVADNLYFRDFGVVRRGEHERDEAQAALQDQAEALDPDLSRTEDRARKILEQARAWQAQIDAGTVRGVTALARGLGMRHTNVLERMKILKLASDLQAQIEAGKADRLSLKAIVRIARKADAEAQRCTFAEELASAPEALSQGGKRKPAAPPRVRLVASFNPLTWRTKARHAKEKAGRLHAALTTLNETPKPVKPEELLVRAAALVQAQRMSDVYTVQLKPADDGAKPQVVLVRDEAVWANQRGRDGMLVVAAAPGLQRNGEELIRLYRSKAMIEANFREMKSVLELRPLRHGADDKVRAHVTLCVLALAVERLLECKLKAGGLPQTAVRAFATLAQVQLNELKTASSRKKVTVVTTPGPAARQLADALGVGWALDNAKVTARLNDVGR